MGKHTNSSLYAKLEQQARRSEPTEYERAAEWDSDEWQLDTSDRSTRISDESSGRGIGEWK